MDKKMLNLRWWFSATVAIVATVFMAGMESGASVKTAAFAATIAAMLAAWFASATFSFAGASVAVIAGASALVFVNWFTAVVAVVFTVMLASMFADSKMAKDNGWLFGRTFVLWFLSVVAAIPAGFWLYTVHPAYGIGVFIADIVAIYPLWPLCRKEYTAPILGA